MNPLEGPHDLVEANRSQEFQGEGWEEQRPGNILREDHHMVECDYGWDSGPLEILPSSIVEADYGLDRGPCDPGGFFLDANDPTFEFFDPDMPS